SRGHPHLQRQAAVAFVLCRLTRARRQPARGSLSEPPDQMSNRGVPMSRLRWAAALCGAAIMAVAGAASAAAAPAAHGSSVAAQVDGQTYVLLGPSVFGVTVQ